MRQPRFKPGDRVSMDGMKLTVSQVYKAHCLTISAYYRVLAKSENQTTEGPEERFEPVCEPLQWHPEYGF